MGEKGNSPLVGAMLDQAKIPLQDLNSKPEGEDRPGWHDEAAEEKEDRYEYANTGLGKEAEVEAQDSGNGAARPNQRQG